MNFLLPTIVLSTSLFIFASSADDQSVDICEAAGELDFDCGAGELRHRCISSLWHCDNVHDCTSGRDEVSCKYLHECPTGHFPCRNGDCLLASVRCNGHEDCGEGEDERGCAAPTKNPKMKATPSQTSSRRAPMSKQPANSNEQHEAYMVEPIAEPFVDPKEDEEQGQKGSALFSLLLLVTALALITLFGSLYIKYSRSRTASQIDATLKELSRGARSTVRNIQCSVEERMPLRQGAVQSTPMTSAFSSPSQYGTANSFDNPMNTMHQPQPYVFQASSTNSPTPITKPLV